MSLKKLKDLYEKAKDLPEEVEPEVKFDLYDRLASATGDALTVIADTRAKEIAAARAKHDADTEELDKLNNEIMSILDSRLDPIIEPTKEELTEPKPKEAPPNLELEIEVDGQNSKS